MNTYELSGRKAIITGAAVGIGRGVAKRLALSGARIALWDIDERRVKATRDSEFSSAFAVGVDVSDAAAVERATAASVAALGGVDILVNCAGIAGTNAPLDQYQLDDFDRVVKVSLYGTFHCCRAVVPEMKRLGYGRIVNFGSMAGKDGNPNACAYSAAKAGVIALTKSLGKELAKSEIRVNAVTPAVIRTEMADAVSPQQLQYMLEKIPMGRMGTIDEVSALVAWLCSEDCSFSTGAVYDISGGRATY